MLSLLTTAALAFVATTHHPVLHRPNCQHHHATPSSMGLFDGFKDAFENNPKLVQKKAAEVNAGKSKKVPDYVKKNLAKQAEYEKMRKSNAPSEQQSERSLDDLFKGWKWK